MCSISFFLFLKRKIVFAYTKKAGLSKLILKPAYDLFIFLYSALMNISSAISNFNVTTRHPTGDHSGLNAIATSRQILDCYVDFSKHSFGSFF